MAFAWQEAFREGNFPWLGEDGFADVLHLAGLATLKRFLDEVHIRHCLLRPWCETGKYPLVDSRDLLPSFEAELVEYKQLPGFSLVAFDRPLQSFNEIFQYDILHPATGEPGASGTAGGESCPLESQIIARNLQTFQARLPKPLQDGFRDAFLHRDIAMLDEYPALLPYIGNMDRGHVFATDSFGHFHLAGIFASFPSDMDGELKRFGLRIGKFRVGDNAMYELNRQFVNQFLMELYGFPIASERRTSAAIFARRLHRLGECFLIRVLGQSDRTITTIWNDGEDRHYPRVEKIALVSVEPEQQEMIRTIDQLGYFVDREERVVILRVLYKQHRYSADNVRQDRALSVERQEIIHPLTGQALPEINLVKDTTTMILRLNDIVRGEYVGRAVYKRTELIENTDTEEKRLKFLYAWLSKNQRRIIGYSEDFYASAVRVLDAYLKPVDGPDRFEPYKELYQEVMEKYAYIRQARTVRYLEDIASRFYRGEKLGYGRMLTEAITLLRDLQFELGTYFETLMQSALHNIDLMLDNHYLRHTYIENDEKKLSRAGLEIRKNYGRLVRLRDDFVSVRRARAAQQGSEDK